MFKTKVSQCILWELGEEVFDPNSGFEPNVVPGWQEFEQAAARMLKFQIYGRINWTLLKQ